ncbi:MAG: DUF2155 domain-containing protein [Paracoccaceae bacterium]|nr:DUF2155 domain-containing protein [Paracoccaceae bacterium]
MQPLQLVPDQPQGTQVPETAPGTTAPITATPITPSTPAAPDFPGQTQTTTQTAVVADANGAVVRWLDKVSGDTVDLTLKKGESKTQGRITVTLGDCRYPKDDPASNAFAYLTIHDNLVSAPIFQGWMIAASPALNALDSARYDVWVLRCTTN